MMCGSGSSAATRPTPGRGGAATPKLDAHAGWRFIHACSRLTPGTSLTTSTRRQPFLLTMIFNVPVDLRVTSSGSDGSEIAAAIARASSTASLNVAIVRRATVCNGGALRSPRSFAC